MLFSEILNTLRQDDTGWIATVPDDWSQGRSIFGGLQAALVLRVMRTLVPGHVPLRVVQTTFVAPVLTGTVHVRARILRAGKNVIHVEGSLVDGEQSACVVVGVFGSSRKSQIEVTPRQHALEAAAPFDFPSVRGVTPEFTRYFTMRWLRGGPPYTGITLPHAVIEVGINDSGKATEEHVVAIADAIPPVALSYVNTPINGSSMTWMLELLRDRVDDLALTGWRLDVDLHAARDGYTSQSVNVWGPGGEPVALSRQCMVVYG